jgi:hypothetical protein
MLSAIILADSGQLIGVLLILAGAVGYLTIYYHRTIKGDQTGCGCGIPLRRKPGKEPEAGRPEEPTSPPSANGDRQQFLPAENLADLAARHRRELDDKSQTADAEPPPRP